MQKTQSKIGSALFSFFIFIIAIPFMGANLKPAANSAPASPISTSLNPDSVTNPVFKKMTMYEGMELESFGLSKKAFEYAMKGYDYLLKSGKLTKKDIITVIDFSKPSTEKRLYVLDVENLKVLYQTYVSHGRNSGKLYATKFSNKPESNMSSLGAYITGNTYFGEHGYSLRLNGEERGINDNAYRRAIVIHSADYASERFIDSQGFLGRSFGCPALPREVAKPVIETIKDGSCIFVYAPSKTYEVKSKIL